MRWEVESAGHKNEAGATMALFVFIGLFVARARRRTWRHDRRTRGDLPAFHAIQNFDRHASACTDYFRDHVTGS
jgi:hypothetical protein